MFNCKLLNESEHSFALKLLASSLPFGAHTFWPSWVRPCSSKWGERKNALPGEVFTANIKHLPLMVKFPTYTSSLSFTCQRAHNLSFYFKNVLRFLLWWPSPLTNTSYNSLYHLEVSGDKCLVQLIIMNSECLMYFGIIPHVSPIYPCLIGIFLYSFQFMRIYFIYLHVAKKRTIKILNRIRVTGRVTRRKSPRCNIQTTLLET